ncbi:TPA: S8 family serine peptidase [Candidatus Woesearchaeota archaeon]|nr:S8 family serine peptidase [Candidatus Woesearchaeota archaeon]
MRAPDHRKSSHLNIAYVGVIIIVITTLFLSGCGGGGKPAPKVTAGYIRVATLKDRYAVDEQITLTETAADSGQAEAYASTEECGFIRLVLVVEVNGPEELCSDVKVELDGDDITSACSPHPLVLRSGYATEIVCRIKAVTHSADSGMGKVYACGAVSNFSYGYAALEERPDYVPGEILIKLKEGTTIEPAASATSGSALSSNSPSLQALLARHEASYVEDVFKADFGATLPPYYLSKGLDHIKLVKIRDADVMRAVAELDAHPNVEYAEPNYIAYLTYQPNDPLYKAGHQWGLRKIQAEPAWGITLGSDKVVIAIIDTGVFYDHPDLMGNMWRNPNEIEANGVDDDGNGYVDDIAGFNFFADNNKPTDKFGHGTHCAGIAAATTNNAEGIAGTCPSCRIMALRVSNDHGDMETNYILEAIYYAIYNKADIISMSFAYYSYPSMLVKEAIDDANADKRVLVAGAGNLDRDTKAYPAGYENVIAVAATNNNDKRWYKPPVGSHYGSWVDLAAPGEDIASTVPYTGVFSDKSGYYLMTGTSMSAPFVSGVAGLLLSKNPGLNTEQVRSLLKKYSDPIRPDHYIGAGRLNAYQALIQKHQSKLVNIGTTTISGLLNIKIQKEQGKGNWQDYITIIDKRETSVEKNSLLGLDGLFDQKNVKISEPGSYRVYAELVDEAGNVITTDHPDPQTPLSASYEFGVIP